VPPATGHDQAPLHWHRQLVYAGCLSILAFLLGRFFLRDLNWRQKWTANPTELGRINGIDVYFHVGDVALPNKLERARPDAVREGYQLSTVTAWDTFATTAPVPHVTRTKKGLRLIVPWTMLPVSVVRSIHSVDPAMAEEAAAQLGIGGGEVDWRFERITRIPVPPESDYARVCKLTSMYGVNLFDFMEELGDDYRPMLRRAVSDAVKQIAEECGGTGENRVAFPALAGARHVVDRGLVLTYAESFGAIIDGLSRAGGTKPSKVVLVAWREAHSAPELDAATEGVRRACYQHLPAWQARLKTAVLATLSVAFMLGVLTAWSRAGGKGRPHMWAFLIDSAVLLPAVLGCAYAKLVPGLLPVRLWPKYALAAVAALAFFTGVRLHRWGVIKLQTPQRGASADAEPDTGDNSADLQPASSLGRVAVRLTDDSSLLRAHGDQRNEQAETED
jgi:hypothetical protein